MAVYEVKVGDVIVVQETGLVLMIGSQHDNDDVLEEQEPTKDDLHRPVAVVQSLWPGEAS